MAKPAVYVAAVVTILVLGLSWPIMTVGVRSIAPLWLSTIRLLGAALMMGVAMALIGHLRVPSRGDFSIVVSVGVIRLALVLALTFSALAFVPPGRSSVLVYTSTLWTAPLAAYFLRESLPPLRLVGVFSGVVGVVVVVQPWTLDWSLGGIALGYALLIGAAMASAAGTVHVRGHHWKAGPIDLMPWQLALAGLLTAALAFAVEGPLSFGWSLQIMAVIIYQALFASVLGFWGVLTMGRSLPATTTNLLLMAVPVVGVGTSVLLVDELLTPTLVVGGALIFGGVTCGIVSDRRGEDRA